MNINSINKAQAAPSVRPASYDADQAVAKPNQLTPGRTATPKISQTGSVLTGLRESEAALSKFDIAGPSLKKLGNRLLQMHRLVPELSSNETLTKFKRLGNSLTTVISQSQYAGDTLIAQDLTLKLNPARNFKFSTGDITARLDKSESYIASVSVQGREPTRLRLNFDNQQWHSNVVSQSESHPLGAQVNADGTLNVDLSRDDLVLTQGIATVAITGESNDVSFGRELYSLTNVKSPVIDADYPNLNLIGAHSMATEIREALTTIKSQLKELQEIEALSALPQQSNLDHQTAMDISTRVQTQLGDGFSGIKTGISSLTGLNQRLLNVLK